MPAFVGQDFVHPATDLYYQLADDADLFPDLEVGRFPARGVEELTNMIDKTLASEWATTTPSWAANAAFLASTDNWDISEGTHDYVIEHFTGPAGYNNLRFYSDKGASTEEVLDAVQNGLTLLTYSGHGATTYWADGPKVTQTQVAELTNELFPVVFSYACVTGTYDLDESFAETWVRSAYGATAFWGASENSYWDEDDILEKAVYEGLFDGDAKSLPLSWMAAMTDFGKLAVWSHYGGEDRSLKYMKSTTSWAIRDSPCSPGRRGRLTPSSPARSPKISSIFILTSPERPSLRSD
ncbi:MAG: C25 family cysteine peptidase [Deltaproteobacteria bacterium]|nr:C25 family cysteine peptidase [Deltaproteobacteria bacterium]